MAALNRLDGLSAEIKSVHTSKPFRRKGIAKLLLQHLIDEAKTSGYKVLYLETVSMASFEAARKLYKNFGFTYCLSFADYVEDPNSVFMHLAFT